MPARLLFGLAAGLLFGVALAACGSGGATRFSGSDSAAPGGGGMLAVGVASLPAELDPLRAESRSERLVVRQVFEPLVARQHPPYEAGPPRRGIAVEWEPSADRRVWRFRLRPGVSFQDGSRLDAGAVVANAQRWRTDPVGAALLPGLTAADAPNPGLVRLIFAAPIRDIPARLTDPRLGLVSPLALDPPSGVAASVARPVRAGSGAFEWRSRSADRLTLGRFRRWWGSRRRLGPVLDSVSFRLVSPARARGAALEDGTIEVAAQLPGRVARPLRLDPLLDAYGAESNAALAYERSVKGLVGPGPEPLSGVWVARVQPSG